MADAKALFIGQQSHESTVLEFRKYTGFFLFLFSTLFSSMLQQVIRRVGNQLVKPWLKSKNNDYNISRFEYILS